MKTILYTLLVLGSFLGSLLAQNTPVLNFEELVKEKFSGRPIDQLEPMMIEPANTQRNKLRESKISGTTSFTEMEPFIAINPTDSNNLVLSYMYFQNGGLMFPVFYTRDGGETWDLSEFHTHRLFFEDTLLQIVGGGDPMMAFDADGKLYFAWLLAGRKDVFDQQYVAHIFWAYSEDGGETWDYEDGEDHFIAKGGANANGTVMDYGRGFFDKPWMACDRSGGPYHNDLYAGLLFYRNNNAGYPGDPLLGNILLHKPDTASTFDESFTHISTNVYTSQFVNVQVDNQGRIHATFLGLGSNLSVEGIFYCRSEDGGQSFSTPLKIADAYGIRQNSTMIIHERENPAPSLAISPDGNTIHVVWSSEERINGEWVIKGYYRHSSFGGQIWGPVKKLSDLDGTSDFRHSMMPVAACNEQGHLSIAWYSIDSTKNIYGNMLSDYILVESRDNGNTFSPPVSLASQPIEFGVFGFVRFSIGDYCNLVRSGSKTYAIWVASDPLGVHVSTYDHDVISGIAEFQPVLSSLSVKSIAPQPARDIARIVLDSDRPQKVGMGIFDIHGKAVSDFGDYPLSKGTQTIEINIPAHVSAGVYMLFIQSDAGFISKKIIVK